MRVLLIKSRSKGGISSHIQHIITGMRAYNIEFQEHEVTTAPIKIIKNFAMLRDNIKKFSPDIVHIHGYKALLFIVFIPRHVKIVVTFHGFLDNLPRLKRKIFQFLLSKVVNKADRIICVSKKLTDQSSESLKIKKDKVTTIHNGVKISESEGLHESGIKTSGNGNVILGACGRLTEAKGFDILIKAFNKIKDAFPVELHIIGDGPAFKKLKDSAQDKIYFLGFQDNPLETMCRFDYFVQPSRTEGCGTAVIEAMSINLPVIISDAGGLPELIEDNVHGLVFKKGDVDDLTRCLTMLLSNRELYKHLGAENKKWVSKNFSISKMLMKTLNLYEEMMGEEVYEEIL
ncbi:glycosyltransferase family 4 protein [Alkalicella caledoniensis]|uniref:Glycosyltransferase family 4 protein n=1 Tax=Alkalicella caledoniensis TaxID=2731377 RepID=A0A7G9W777_ALKCA|nr:glycosyltransferase family 4 protein [Alkalicella caledoniensis]QNO14539.1 glycosyltransferase family 4 protein [Alkalicella caledoniensis]